MLLGVTTGFCGNLPHMRETQQNVTAQRLLTADQLAERWQIPRSHVYRLTREAKIPAVRLGKYYRYRLDAIEAFETGRQSEPA
jgi:excisionase family DNA binding protein